MFELFLNPALLGGATLVTVPVVLHLIMRQRPRPLEFPALRFVRKAQELNRRTLRLRHWLLLVLRMLVIALLAAALARPTIQASGWLLNRQSAVDAVLIFDTAPHMEYRHENRSRLDAARDTATWLLTQLPEESRVAIVDGDTPEAVYRVDLGAAKQGIGRLRTTGTSRPPVQLLSPALDLLDQSERRREVYIFSDLAAASWQSDSDAAAEALRKRVADVSVYLIDVGVDNPQNMGLSELRLSGQTIARGSSLSITTDVQSIGRGGKKSVELFLMNAEGEFSKRDSESIEVPADESAPVQLSVGSLEPGTRQGMVQMTGGDGLPADDQRYFTIDVRPAWRLLIVAPSPADRQAFYVTEALAPELYRRNGQARFLNTTITFSELNTQKLEDYSAVLLLDPPALLDASWSKLTTYVLGGGNLAVCLGEEASRSGFNVPNVQELLPAPLENIARYPDGDIFLTTADAAHPLLSRFRALRGEVPWEAFPVFRAWRLGALQTGTTVIARYNNNDPAIIERPLGQGRVLVYTTPLSERPDVRSADRWNLLATGFEPWPFVMLINETALYLVGSSAEQLNYLVGQTAVLRLDPNQRISTYLLHIPGGEPLPRNVPPQQTSIVESLTAVPGNYRIEAGSAEGGIRRGFSANLSTSATQLKRIEPDALDLVFGKGHYHLSRNVEQIERDVNTGRTGQELFPLLMGLVAMVLAFEHVLANRFYRESK